MLKTLGAQVKQYRWVTFITPVFSALEAVADMFLPMLMSQIIDKGVKVGGQAGMQAVLHYGAIMVAVAIGALVCGILAGRFASIASTGFAANLRQAMFANIQSFSFSNIDRFSTAGLVTRLTTDVSNVQLSYQMITRARACHAHHGAHHGIFHSRQPEHDLRCGHRDSGGYAVVHHLQGDGHVQPRV